MVALTQAQRVTGFPRLPPHRLVVEHECHRIT